MEEFPNPFPLGSRSSQNKFGNVKVIYQQGLPDPVDHHGDRGIGVGDLEDLLDVLPIRNNINIRKTIDKVISYPETGEARMKVLSLVKAWNSIQYYNFSGAKSKFTF